MANTLCVGHQMHLLLIVRSGDTIVLDVNLAFICKMAFKFVCFFFFFHCYILIPCRFVCGTYLYMKGTF